MGAASSQRCYICPAICISTKLRILRQGVLYSAIIVGVIFTGGDHKDIDWHIDSHVDAWLLGLVWTAWWMWVESFELFDGVAQFVGLFKLEGFSNSPSVSIQRTGCSQLGQGQAGQL